MTCQLGPTEVDTAMQIGGQQIYREVTSRKAKGRKDGAGFVKKLIEMPSWC